MREDKNSRRSDTRVRGERKWGCQEWEKTKEGVKRSNARRQRGLRCALNT